MNKLNVKKIAIISLSVIFIIFAFTLTILLLNKNNTKNYDSVYGTITEIGKNYLKVNPVNSDESLMILTDNTNYKVGDFIYAKLEDNKANKIDLIASSSETNTIIENTTTHLYTVTTAQSTTNEITEKKTTKTTTVVTKTLNKDEEILNYINTNNDKYSNSTDKKSVKEYFCTLVDFIFYGGKINNISFTELSDSAKEKVIYLTLKIDSIIDKNIPGYKEELSSSYKNAKKELIAKYTDITSNICLEHPDACNTIKDDINDLKYSLNITWDIVLDVFNEIVKPAGAQGLKKLSDWYMVWKNE